MWIVVLLGKTLTDPRPGPLKVARTKTGSPWLIWLRGAMHARMTESELRAPSGWAADEQRAGQRPAGGGERGGAAAAQNALG
jgi:hypothetical protein